MLVSLAVVASALQSVASAQATTRECGTVEEPGRALRSFSTTRAGRLRPCHRSGIHRDCAPGSFLRITPAKLIRRCSEFLAVV